MTGAGDAPALSVRGLTVAFGGHPVLTDVSLDLRRHVQQFGAPFLGWLDAWLKPYPETLNLKTRVHPRDDTIRPYIELEPTDHPLAVEQRNGITVERVAELYAITNHDRDSL